MRRVKGLRKPVVGLPQTRAETTTNLWYQVVEQYEEVSILHVSYGDRAHIYAVFFKVATEAVDLAFAVAQTGRCHSQSGGDGKRLVVGLGKRRARVSVRASQGG